MRFAEMERKLGEVDRAREIYAYCSQICDPRITSEFWTKWTDFEVAHGNEDTMKELLRIKRSMQAKYNTQVGTSTVQHYNYWYYRNAKKYIKNILANDICLLTFAVQYVNDTAYFSGEHDVSSDVGVCRHCGRDCVRFGTWS